MLASGHKQRLETPLIDLYTWSTPNGRKISIMLEEVGLPYEVHPIHIGKDEQFSPEFLKISPNNKIPAIVDRDNDWSVFESGAILIYLAEKTGRFLPTEPRARIVTLEWLMFQMGGLGPFLGQAHHFMRAAKEKIPYAITRYHNEAKRLYGVMDRRLADNRWLAGEDYTVADIASFPWAARHDWHQVDFAEFPNVRRWYDTIKARPAVQAGYDVPPTGAQMP